MSESSSLATECRRFLDECFVPTDNVENSTAAVDLYVTYLEWALKNGAPMPSLTAFGAVAGTLAPKGRRLRTGFRYKVRPKTGVQVLSASRQATQQELLHAFLSRRTAIEDGLPDPGAASVLQVGGAS